MLSKISRIMLIILVIIIAAVYLPHYYWISFSERIRPSYIQFSPVIEKFIIMDYEKNKFMDVDGTEYTREQTDELLPLSHYSILLKKGLLPDSLKEVELKVEDIRLNSINFRIKPSDINPPQIPLYPLFESQPERFKLEMPKEFFRIKKKMEFIDCQSNEIIHDLSNSFTKSLQSKGFEFPSTRTYGNPTTRKAFDEGYFVFDSKDQLFHIKRIKDKPFCEQVNIPDNVNIKTIFLREYSLKEFYAFIVTEDNKLYLLLFDDYKFQELPIENYNSDKDMLRFQGNIFYRSIVIYKENQLNVFVTDREYNIVDTYQEKWLSNKEKQAGIISKYIFPFELEIISSDSEFIDFYLSGFSFSAIYFNIILVLLSIFIMRKKNVNLIKGILDYIVILITGLFGFIAVTIFRYEE